MRSTEEQLQEIVARSNRMRAASHRRRAVRDALAAAACIALMVYVAYAIPSLDGVIEQPGAQYGSLIITGSSLGYVLIAALAFLLGIFVTLLALHLRNSRNG